MRRPLFAAWIALLGAAAVTGTGGNVRAQEAARAIEFEDFGFTDPAEPGARASALHAPAVLFGDATTLVGNTAGLARLGRIHGTVSVDHETSRCALDYGQAPSGYMVSATRLSFAGAAVPMRVLRGGFVPAIAVHRAFSSDLDLAYARNNELDGRSENYRRWQSGATYAFSVGLGTDISPLFSAGFSVFMLNGSMEVRERYDWHPLVTSPSEHTFVDEDSRSDVGGYGARVGMLLFVHRHLRLGFNFNAPTVVTVKTNGTRETTRQVANNVGSFVQEPVTGSAEYILPYRASGALAVPYRSLLMTAAFEYADWTQAAIDGQRIYTQDSDTVFERVIGWSAGAEWTSARIPLRLRAGIAHAPTPLKYLQSDRIDDNGLTPVISQSGRTRISAGAALLLWSKVTVDAAWVRTTGSRTTAVFSDDCTATLVQFQGAYWF